MRGFVVITDSELMPAFEAAFLESGDHGFTIVPRVVGRGRTVVPDVEAEPTARFLRDARDRAGAAEQTKIFSLLVDQAD